MKDRACTRNFPKAFLQSTEQGADNYPKYRRRSPDDGSHTGTKRAGRTAQQEVTNVWVVPYNPYLIRQFNCHINVEMCSSIKSIKYVLKYVHKGTDQAVFQLQQTHVQGDEPDRPIVDEIARFQNARYVGSSEAAPPVPDARTFPPSPATGSASRERPKGILPPR